MEATSEEKKETTTSEVKRGWTKWGSRIFNFLAMGGFLLVIVAIVAIVIIISILFK